jgi:hypothetical protein
LALKLNRENAFQSVTIASGAATSGVMMLDGFSFGGVILPSTYDGTTAIGFTVCDTFSGTYVALEDATGAAITVVGEASKAYPLPPEIFAFPYGKLVAPGNQSTTDTVIPVCLKA